MVHCPFLSMGKRGRPRKIKTLEQYTISELRDMPVSSMVKLFMGDLLGKKTVVATPVKKSEVHIETKELPKEKRPEKSVLPDLMELPLEKKADDLAEALMGYLKKSK